MKWMNEKFVKKLESDGVKISKTLSEYGKKYSEAKDVGDIFNLVSEIGKNYTKLSKEEQNICNALEPMLISITYSKTDFDKFLEDYEGFIYDETNNNGMSALHTVKPISLLSFKLIETSDESELNDEEKKDKSTKTKPVITKTVVDETGDNDPDSEFN